MGRKPGEAALPSPTTEAAQVPGQLTLDGTPPAMLKPRAEEFCWQFCANGGNASAAYRQAFKTSNARVSHANASRLLRDPAVQQRIQEIRRDRSLQLEVLADYLVDFLATVLRLDRAEFLDDAGQFKPLSELPEEARRILDLKTALGRNGEVLALPDVPGRMEAAKELARILGLYKDRVQVAAAIAVTPVQRIVREIVYPEPDPLLALDVAPTQPEHE